MRDSWEGGRGDIQIVAIKDVYVHCKCTTSQLHIMYYIDIYNANNRLLNVFFLSQEKPQATVSDTRWTSTYRIKWKMNTCHVHLTLAAGYWDLLFFLFVLLFLFYLLIFVFKSTRPPRKVQTGSNSSTLWLLHEEKRGKRKRKEKKKKKHLFPQDVKIAKSYKVCPVI